LHLISPHQDLFAQTEPNLFVLLEDGQSFQYVLEQHYQISSNNSLDQNIIIVIGDEIGFSQSDEEFLRRVGTIVSVGPIPVLASQAITIAHNLIDINMANQIKKSQKKL
jgi:tRNA pseudouridine-54 N-methylase